ncbi:hypothetical protein E2C01_010351 [Portunus trituberculatus]|uniref:Uncharacterized protein n=1 Tax=Portunus trituberculatus TaxID=210409 RepID=A0A5B7D8G0_PORTR|nr:hypothetical protein [Portunus trituberculatus]
MAKARPMRGAPWQQCEGQSSTPLTICISRVRHGASFLASLIFRFRTAMLLDLKTLRVPDSLSANLPTWLKLQEYLIVFLGDTAHGDSTEVVALVQLCPEARCTVHCARLIDDEVEVCAGDAQDTQFGQASKRPNDRNSKVLRIAVAGVFGAAVTEHTAIRRHAAAAV